MQQAFFLALAFAVVGVGVKAFLACSAAYSHGVVHRFSSWNHWGTYLDGVTCERATAVGPDSLCAHLKIVP